MNGLHAMMYLVATAVTLVMAGPAIAQGTDPATEPQPQFDFAGQPVAVILNVTLTDIGDAQLDGVDVSNVPAPSYVADPPLLQISYFDSDDDLLGLNNAWDPRWVFQETDTGGEQQLVESPADGVFFIPLSPDLVRVVITDLATEQVLLDADVSVDVQGFCTDNPDHVSCATDEFFDDGFESP